jgi:hypothetical protein
MDLVQALSLDGRSGGLCCRPLSAKSTPGPLHPYPRAANESTELRFLDSSEIIPRRNHKELLETSLDPVYSVVILDSALFYRVHGIFPEFPVCNTGNDFRICDIRGTTNLEYMFVIIN